MASQYSVIPGIHKNHIFGMRYLHRVKEDLPPERKGWDVRFRRRPGSIISNDTAIAFPLSSAYFCHARFRADFWQVVVVKFPV